MSSASLASALESMSRETPMQFQEGLETLLIYIDNLKKFPDDPKYRKIKIPNIHFQERLGRISGSKEALEAVGFTVEGTFYVFDKHNVLSKDEIEMDLRSSDKIIRQRLQDVQKEVALLPVRLPLEHRYVAVAGVGAHSEKGKRPAMEDDEIAVDEFCGDETCAYFGLYDGHGGRPVVNFVVKALHKNVEFLLRNQPTASIPDVLKDAYLITDGQVRRANILHSGTTSVSCIIRSEKDSQYPELNRRMLYCANVGDSRAVLCRNGVAVRLTIDHKPNLVEEKKRIEDAGGFIGRCNRVNGLLAISRALGDHMLKPNEVVSAVPHTKEEELRSDDKYLILACDGVWDVIEDQEAVDFVFTRMQTFDEDPKLRADKEKLNLKLEQVAKDLVQLALDKRSLDNITVMIIKL